MTKKEFEQIIKMDEYSFWSKYTRMFFDEKISLSDYMELYKLREKNKKKSCA
jgi:hypothetical protein